MKRERERGGGGSTAITGGINQKRVNIHQIVVLSRGDLKRISVFFEMWQMALGSFKHLFDKRNELVVLDVNGAIEDHECLFHITCQQSL